MHENRKSATKLLLTAAGAAAAYFAVRALMDWMRSGASSRAWRSRDWHNRDFQQGQTSRQEARAAQVRGFQGRSTRAGSMSQQQVDQPDRQPIPNTGQTYTTTEMSGLLDADAPPVSVEDQTGPLAQYLLAFHELIQMLRERRSAGSEASSGLGRSLNAGDRARFDERLQRLDELLPEYGEGNLEENSLQERVYRLIWKARDGLQNLNYDDDDLFRINGEIRTEACRLLREIRDSGFSGGEDFEQAISAYECG